MSNSVKTATIVSVLVLLVIGAAFMPWVTVNPTRAGHVMAVNGWNSTMLINAIRVPNWLCILAAAFVCALSWCRPQSTSAAPTVVAMVVAVYGLLHAAFIVTVFLISEKTTVGPGPGITAAAFFAMFVALLRDTRLGAGMR